MDAAAGEATYRVRHGGRAGWPALSERRLPVAAAAAATAGGAVFASARRRRSAGGATDVSRPPGDPRQL